MRRKNKENLLRLDCLDHVIHVEAVRIYSEQHCPTITRSEVAR